MTLFVAVYSLNSVYASPRSDAQEMIASGTRLPEAMALLSPLAKSSQADIVAEYSLALASSGLISAALYEMDRAFILDGADNEVRFAGSTLLSSLGLVLAGEELMRPAPSWIKGPLKLLSMPRKRDDVMGMGSYFLEIKAASELMEKARYISALDRFARITAIYPSEPLGWAGYAIALEKIGAFQTSAKAVAMEMAVSPQMETDTRASLTDYQNDLLALPPVAKKKFSQSLQGRYMAFVGGSYSGGKGAPQSLNLMGQMGKFLTNYFNVSIDYAYSSENGSVYGLGERLYYHLPISLTLGSRIEGTSVAANESHLGLVVSPGLSYFFASGGSIDLFYDFGISGSQKNRKTLSLGFTSYFGGGK